MIRRSLLLFAALASLACSQEQTKPGELQKEREKPRTSGKQEVPAEEDKSYLKEVHTFNPLQSKNSVQVGDGYWRKGKVQAGANHYLDATLWNESNTEAWLKLAKANERLKDYAGAKAAYAKYLELAPNVKDAADIRKKMEHLK